MERGARPRAPSSHDELMYILPYPVNIIKITIIYTISYFPLSSICERASSRIKSFEKELHEGCPRLTISLPSMLGGSCQERWKKTEELFGLSSNPEMFRQISTQGAWALIVFHESPRIWYWRLRNTKPVAKKNTRVAFKIALANFDYPPSLGSSLTELHSLLLCIRLSIVFVLLWARRPGTAQAAPGFDSRTALRRTHN